MKLHDPAMFTDTDTGPVLVAQECRTCGKVAFPRKRVCPACFGEDLADRPLSMTGTLHTWTCTYLGAPHLPSPYLLGFVDLPEGVRLLSLLVDCEPWEEILHIGMPMEMTIGPLMQDDSGEVISTYKFRPLGQDGAVA